jgi:hypothetical protein
MAVFVVDAEMNGFQGLLTMSGMAVIVWRSKVKMQGPGLV